MTRAELRRLFQHERARDARHAPWVAHAQLTIVEARCIEPGRCAFRDLAFADTKTGELAMLERALQLPRANVLGLLRHELGHLADLRVARVGREQRADNIAAAVCGGRISYDARDVQTVGRGRYPRPKYLHR